MRWFDHQIVPFCIRKSGTPNSTATKAFHFSPLPWNDKKNHHRDRSFFLKTLGTISDGAEEGGDRARSGGQFTVDLVSMKITLSEGFALRGS